MHEVARCRVASSRLCEFDALREVVLLDRICQASPCLERYKHQCPRQSCSVRFCNRCLGRLCSAFCLNITTAAAAFKKSATLLTSSSGHFHSSSSVAPSVPMGFLCWWRVWQDLLPLYWKVAVNGADPLAAGVLQPEPTPCDLSVQDAACSG